MKYLSIILSFFLLCQNSKGQSILNKTYAFKGNINLDQVKIDGNPSVIPYTTQTKVGDLFKLLRLSNDKQFYIIQFLPFSEISEEQKLKRTKDETAAVQLQTKLINREKIPQLFKSLFPVIQAMSTLALNSIALQPSQYRYEPDPVSHPPFTDDRVNNNYFLLAVEDFTNQATDDFYPRNSLLVLSSLILPYKLNFGNKQPGSGFNFAHNITVGPAFGLRHRTSQTSIGDQAIDYLFNIGITSINVDQKTVPGIVTESTNLSAFTLGAGIAYEFGKIQLGIFTGIDILTGDANRAYVYKNSPYLSIGLGFQIFSMKTAGSTQ
jgi:hypothetical protein